MQIPVQQFPILTPGQMNPFHQALQGGLDTYMNMTKAAYAPLTMQADAASKLTYANLMGPQFLAKLMGNEDILANLSPDQRDAALKKIYQAGAGQGMGNPLLNSGNNQSPSFFDKLKNFFTTTNQNSQQFNPQQGNATTQNSVFSDEDKKNISNMKPGDSYMVQGNQPQELIDNKDKFYENVARAKGIKEEGQKAGELRAQNINDLGETIKTSQDKITTLKGLNGILSSPEIRQMRSTPALGAHELNWYKQYGTPDQQQMVGSLMTLTGSVIRDSARDFPGPFRKGEQELFNNMKVNLGDTVDSAIGKAQALNYLTQMKYQRSAVAYQLMQSKHISQADAFIQADKQLNGNAIRNKIYNELNPKPNDRDIEYMAKLYNISTDEVRKRLKKKGRL